MGIPVCDVVIGEYSYEVKALDAVTGRKAFVKLVNMLGPSFKDGMDDAAVFAELAHTIKPEDMDHFCKLFGARTEVSGPGIAEGSTRTLTEVFFMEHFASNYFDMLEWLAFCLKVNFESFFRGMQRLQKDLRPKVETSPSAKA